MSKTPMCCFLAFIVIAFTVLSLTGCDNATTPSGGFVAVTGITGVPTAATAGTPLTLIGTVEPANATNKAIVWSVVSGSATVSGNTLTATAAGTVTIRGTIINGTAQGTNYTQDFGIAVDSVGDGTDFLVTNTAEWDAAKATIRGGGNDKSYTITVSGNVPVGGSTSYTFGMASGITVTLQGSGKLYLTSRGGIIDLYTNQILIIDSANLTLQGLKSGQNGATEDNTTSLVRVNGAALELRNGTISGNTTTSSTFGNTSIYGGGVYVNNGSFTMNGGKISGNILSPSSSSSSISSAACGGGVYVMNNGSFTMNGGEISGNILSPSPSSSSSSVNASGGGVYVSDGSFTMNGGEISGNILSSSSSSSSSSTAYGGGVYVSKTTFTMNGGTISGNTLSASASYYACAFGGGVYVSAAYTGDSGSFTMSDGTISGNTLSASVSASNDAFAYAFGGGVCAPGSYVNITFTMSGGTISGNTLSAYAPNSNYAFSSGGGVHFTSIGGGIFTKSGGTIYGYSSGALNSNVVKNNLGSVLSNQGHAVAVDESNNSLAKRRETTAGPGVNMDSSVAGAAGGWEN